MVIAVLNFLIQKTTTIANTTSDNSGENDDDEDGGYHSHKAICGSRANSIYNCGINSNYYDSFEFVAENNPLISFFIIVISQYMSGYNGAMLLINDGGKGKEHIDNSNYSHIIKERF